MSLKAALLTLIVLPVQSLPAICQAPPSGTSTQRIRQPSAQDEAHSHAQAAQQYLREHKPELAIPELQKVVALEPNNVEARANIGVLFFFRSEYKEAVPQLRAAIQLQPNLSRIQALLGIAEEHTSDFPSARLDLETSFPLLEDKKFKTQAGLELLGIYTQTGILDQAASIAAQLQKADPENPEVQYAAYRTYADLAGESMLNLSLIAPDSAQMHQVMAHEETRLGNNAGAIANYRKAIAIDPHLPGVHFELAELLNASDDVTLKKQAEVEYRAAIEANPMDEKAESRLAEIDAKKGNAAQALSEYSKAIELQPSDSDAKLGLAKLLIDKNEDPKATALLEQTVQLEPTNATAHYRLGMLYRQAGRIDDAKREIDLYKKYKAMKEKLRAIYKEMQIQPETLRAEDPVEK
jgi:cytochrome c-type biogenesis protein CcmH/NrfG